MFVRELFRVLKKGGICLISTLNVDHNKKAGSKAYTKFFQHHKEFDQKELRALLEKIFPRVEMYGLEISIKHRIFQRLKKWGFSRYNFKYNLVKKFYKEVSPKDFRIKKNVSRKSLDLIALCKK